MPSLPSTPRRPFSHSGVRLLVGVTVALVGAPLSGCAGPNDATSAISSTPAPTAESSTPTSRPVTSQPPGPATEPEPSAQCATITPIRVLLPGQPGPRYAGIHAAQASGAYVDLCLAVTTNFEQPPQPLGADPADPQIAAWTTPEGLAVREAGADVTNVAQVFQRSGLRQVSWADAPVASPDAFRDRRVGLPPGGGYEVIAASSRAGLDPVADISLITPGGYRALLDDSVDAAAVQAYDGLVRLRSSTRPATGLPVTETDLAIVDYASLGLGLLPDGLWTNASALQDPAYRDAIQRFITATFRGWIECRDDPDACTTAVHDAAPDDSVDAQRQMVAEVNGLIWPSPQGIGAVDQQAWDRTVAISLATKSLAGDRLITAPPTDGAQSSDLAGAARDALSSEGLNVTG